MVHFGLESSRLQIHGKTISQSLKIDVLHDNTFLIILIFEERYLGKY